MEIKRSFFSLGTLGVLLLCLSSCGPLFERPDFTPPEEVLSLKAEVTLPGLPAEEDPICPTLPYYDHDNDFQRGGLQAGDSVADFTLYGVRGRRFTLSSALLQGKPVFLFTLSFSSPESRANLPALQKLYERYHDRVTFCGVYTLETRPDDSFSPYEEHLLDSGLEEPISEHLTYGDRWHAASRMEEATGITFPLYVDDACNRVWQAYDRAPHAGFLIRPKGRLYSKHGWLHVDDMAATIDQLLEESAPIPVP